jgi:tRNA pseudouridine55 synthase
MQDKINVVYKKRGQTPLECINELKKANEHLLHLPLTYAGRLDPLAEGVLVILIGDECLKKDEYLKLPKEYETTILFGFETDTYDLMGLVTKVKELEVQHHVASDVVPLIRNKEDEKLEHKNLYDDLVLRFKKLLPQFTGRIKQSYPPYSSRTVNGKPLYQWSREGKLREITIPSHDVFVESIDIIDEGFISGEDFLSKIKNDISLVGGDFRQKEIVDLWKNILKDKKEEQYKTITLRVSCGSGVYVRGIAHELGVALGVPALALNIKRTKVGEYSIEKLFK